MSLPAHESDLLRQMVRQVLQEIVPQTMATSAAGAGEAVTIANEADLQSFARRIAAAPQSERDAIIAGSTTFSLAAPVPPAASLAATPSGAEVRVEKGAVTERHVREAASAGAVLVLGRKAVLTPLARDRARAAGVEITKEK